MSAKNIVLVHGGFVDGSGWQGVYDLLSKDGYHVAVAQNPTLSLEDDVAVTRRLIDAQDGPAFWLATPTAARSSLRRGCTTRSRAWCTSRLSRRTRASR